MKTIALSMIFSLAVIVCEQQTLFAPHFVTFDGFKAASPTNSLVPIAGVNRLVPVAGTSNYCRDNWCVSGGDPTSKNRDSYDCQGIGLFATGSDDRGKVNDKGYPKPTKVEQPVHGPHILTFDGLSGRGQEGISEDDDGYPEPTIIERPVFGPHIISF
jgi:hypothetical protein